MQNFIYSECTIQHSRKIYANLLISSVYILIQTYECFVYQYVHALLVCPLSKEARERYRIFRSQSYRQCELSCQCQESNSGLIKQPVFLTNDPSLHPTNLFKKANKNLYAYVCACVQVYITNYIIQTLIGLFQALFYHMDIRSYRNHHSPNPPVQKPQDYLQVLSFACVPHQLYE